MFEMLRQAQNDISNTNCSSVKLKRCHAEPVEASFKLNMIQKSHSLIQI